MRVAVKRKSCREADFPFSHWLFCKAFSLLCSIFTLDLSGQNSKLFLCVIGVFSLILGRPLRR